MRLIDADEVLNQFQEYMDNYASGTAAAVGVSYCMDYVDKAPTVEPEENWIPFRLREMTEEEREYYPPEVTMMWCEPTPEHGQQILVSDGVCVWEDTFYSDEVCYLESDKDLEEGMAWMPMPKAHKVKV